MANTANYFTTLLKLSGVADEAKIKELANRIGDFDLGEDLTKLEQNILTRDAAKSNSEVYGHVKAEVLNGFDSKLTDLANKVGISVEQQKELFKDKQTLERLTELSKTIKEIVEKPSQENPDLDALKTHITIRLQN